MVAAWYNVELMDLRSEEIVLVLINGPVPVPVVATDTIAGVV